MVITEDGQAVAMSSRVFPFERPSNLISWHGASPLTEQSSLTLPIVSRLELALLPQV